MAELLNLVKNHRSLEANCKRMIESFSRYENKIGSSSTATETVSIVNLNGPKTYEKYFDALRPSMRENIRKSHNRLSKLGSISFEIVSARDDKFPEILSVMIAWKKEWLIRNGILSKDVFKRGFLNTLLSSRKCEMSPKNYAWCAVLSLNEEPIAAQFAITSTQETSLYFAAHKDMPYNISSGHLCTVRIIEWLSQQGKTVIDFGVSPAYYKTCFQNSNIDIAVSSSKNRKCISIFSTKRLKGFYYRIPLRFRRGIVRWLSIGIHTIKKNPD